MAGPIPQSSSPEEQHARTATVVVPTWNRSRLLAQTLSGLRQQCGGVSFEVVVIENGSCDTAVLQRDFPEFRFFCLRERGVCAARNLGARQARSSLLIFLDDDVVPSADFVSAHVSAHEHFTERVVIGALRWEIDPERKCFGLETQVAAERLLPVPTSDGSTPCGLADFRTGNFSLRRELLERVGGFDESFDPYGGEEVDLGIRLAAVNADFQLNAAAWGTHVSAATEVEFYQKARESGAAEARLLRKHGRDAPHVCDEFIVRSFLREPAAWQRRIVQRVPRLVHAIGRAFALVARMPGPQQQGAAVTANAIRHLQERWKGVTSVLTRDDLHRLIFGPVYTPARVAVTSKDGLFDVHEATEALQEQQPRFVWARKWARGGRVLDLGCNDGALAHSIAQRDAFALGADRFKYACVAAQTYGVPVVALDAERTLPFVDHAFDTVIVSGLLECVADPGSALREVRRILRPGGCLVLIGHNRDRLLERQRRWRRLLSAEFGFSIDHWQQLLGGAGFSIKKVEACPLKVTSGRFRKVYWAERLGPASWATDFAFLCEPQ